MSGSTNIVLLFFSKYYKGVQYRRILLPEPVVQKGRLEMNTIFLIGKIEWKWPVSRNSRGRRDNIKIEFKETTCENLNQIQAVQWWVLVAQSSV